MGAGPGAHGPLDTESRYCRTSAADCGKVRAAHGVWDMYLILKCASGDSGLANVRAMQQADRGMAVSLFVRGVIAVCLFILILQTAAAVWSRTVLAMALGQGGATASSVSAVDAGAPPAAGDWSTSFFATAPNDLGEAATPEIDSDSGAR